MVNIPEFTSRLKKVMDFHQLTASMFADKIGVQRSSISHILSGRNKPSLDFILKVTAEFSEVDMYWLLNGKGIFPKNSKNTTPSAPSQLNNTHKTSEKKIERIVVFYNDGTFDEFKK
jgi:transcriptional regulator with XRE-family HTH domain|tara:strand:+ start:243 stop:593 length:351 start_codon:yes stop_codon:yes gene_type:complete